MANVYGCSESEKNVLDVCPDSVKKYEDIEIIHQQLSSQLKKEEKIFFHNLPDRIKQEETSLESIRDHRKMIIQKFDDTILGIKNKIKKAQWLLVPFYYIELIIEMYYYKPLEIRKNKTLEMKQQSKLSKLNDNPQEFFNNEQSELIDKFEEFDKIKQNQYYYGAYGEVKILNELLKLDNKHHILCGLNIELVKWNSYGNKRFNLKSAQMDFVVICPKGVFLIEVKNWGTDHYYNSKNISPHEQLDRAGRILYKFLKSRYKEVKINKILIPINNNIPYDKNYKFVLVSNIDKINNFIDKEKDELSNHDIKKILSILIPFVTER